MSIIRQRLQSPRNRLVRCYDLGPGNVARFTVLRMDARGTARRYYQDGFCHSLGAVDLSETGQSPTEYGHNCALGQRIEFTWLPRAVQEAVVEWLEGAP